MSLHYVYQIILRKKVKLNFNVIAKKSNVFFDTGVLKIFYQFSLHLE